MLPELPEREGFPMNKVQILLADDHEIVREGLRAMITRGKEWEVCGDASTGRQAVELAQKLSPDVVVMDIGMPDLNGLDATRQIKRRGSYLYRKRDGGDSPPGLPRGGARLPAKDRGKQTPHPCNRHTLQSSHLLLLAPLRGDLLELPPGERSRQRGWPLTLRERETIQLIAEGKSNKEIADLFEISVKTVETHRAAIMRKLHIDSFAALVRYAIRNGIVEA